MAKKEKQINAIKPKEFVYVDEIELNSILAQLENGLPSVIHDMQQALSGVTKIDKKDKSNSGSAGIAAVLKASGEHTNLTSKSTKDISQNINQQAIDTVYSDYAVNVILKRLETEQLLKSNTHQEPGSFVKLNSNFNIYNFDSMYKLTSNSYLQKMIAEQGGDISDEELQTQLAGIDQISSLTNIYEEVTKGVDLISVKNALIFAESKNFRMNATQRKMLSLRKTKINIFGIIESVVSESDMTMDGLEETENVSGLDGFYSKTNFFLLSLLGESTLKKNDRLIKPIAIYFE